MKGGTPGGVRGRLSGMWKADFAQPDRVLPAWVDAEKRQAFFRDNALRVYGRQMP